MRLVAWVAALALLVGPAVAKDRLLLEDGQVVEGDLIAINRTDVQFRTGGETMRVPRAAVDKIERIEILDLSDDGPMSRDARPAASRELQAWIELCVEHLDSPDPGVRAGAEMALRLTGLAAQPALEAAFAEGTEGIPAAATRLLAELKRIRERSAQRRSPVDALSRALELTDEQLPEFKRIMGAFYASQAELSESVRGGEMEAEEADEQAQGLRAELDRQLAELLTDEQLERYREILPRRPPAAPAP